MIIRTCDISCGRRVVHPDLTAADNRLQFGKQACLHAHQFSLTAAASDDSGVSDEQLDQALAGIRKQLEHRDITDATDWFKELPATTEHLAVRLKTDLEARVGKGAIRWVRLDEDATYGVEYRGDGTTIRNEPIWTLHALEFTTCRRPAGNPAGIQGIRIHVEGAWNGRIHPQSGIAGERMTLQSILWESTVNYCELAVLNDLSGFRDLEPDCKGLAKVFWNRMLQRDPTSPPARVRVTEWHGGSADFHGEQDG